MKPILDTLLGGKALDRPAAIHAMREMLAPETRPEQIAAVLTALRLRGETLTELSGFLEALREQAVRLPAEAADAFDTCGTGGDGAGTFNISTAAAFVLAGGGVRVAKHGNRSASSGCGSADVLEAIGTRLDRTPTESAHALARDGFTFLYAPRYHPALARLAPVRRALAFRTVFNVLGPLANPARVRRQIVGVSDRRLLPLFAELLRDAGCESALVVAAADGMDELSLSGATYFARLNKGSISQGALFPDDFGLPTAPREALRGGDAQANARLLLGIFGNRIAGAPRAVVEMNAAAGFVVAGHAKTFREGMALASQSIDSGRAAVVVEESRQ